VGLEAMQIIGVDQKEVSAIDQFCTRRLSGPTSPFEGSTGMQDIWKNRTALGVFDHRVSEIGGKDLRRGCGKTRNPNQWASSWLMPSCKPEWQTLLRLARTTDKVVPSEEFRAIL